MARTSRRAGTVAIDLALQGGGSHGAFTWGVLDRLLEDESIALDGLSGTSAGALNAAVLATGLAKGGRTGARHALAAFWRDVSDTGHCFGAIPPGPWTQWWQQWLQQASPYQFNPFDINPLRDLVRRHVHEEALRAGPLQLFVTATAVRTGQPRVFQAGDLSHDALLASACLPHLFRAVEVDGEPYWDGGYTGNPALWPLIYQTVSTDILLVKINPLVRPDLPDTAVEIADRVAEISFNAGLVGELRAISFVHRLLAEERVSSARYKALRMHMIGDEASLGVLPVASKLDTSGPFLLKLHGLGHAAATRWLAAHRADLGVRATLDIDATFLQPRGPSGTRTVQAAATPAAPARPARRAPRRRP
ncbi:MAG: patatin-like phospholipase family protein [Rubrivivax sp.]|jgi:NTE family protein|nr:patatin-like phospholipase family protein [Rubrivivax sp.]